MAVKLQDSYIMQRAYAGRVQARRESVLGFESAGRLARVRLDEGATVAQGELIAELDTERLPQVGGQLLPATAPAADRIADMDRIAADRTTENLVVKGRHLFHLDRFQIDRL